ncbi:AtpZ/AtpI family protein [Paracoccus tegillarcae]|uniref:ATP synthase protein I n=1 Tax=Paracoccus tegillarcae TaxID=1529068 RepID=A0A2K9ED47_9RHOB|nr:AtpZ/AtpI family protein [Paracoccus tegillarcae]AUH32868.1 F0F1 ATP synthase subunit I [Paracoccus tegillarcae]
MAEGPLENAERAKDAARLRDLEDRLTRKTRVGDGPKPMATHDQAHIAWRMVIELVAGLGIGFGIGYGLDLLLGTMPVMLILFIFLGFAAGIKTMMRTAAELNETSGKTADDTAQPAKTAEKDERG